MSTTLLRQPHYSGVIEAAERPFVRICSAEGDTVFSFSMMTREDVCRFVSFLNENQIERAHVSDCFHDFLYDFYRCANRETGVSTERDR